MTQPEQRPVVLYRYDGEEARASFATQFADDFAIEYCASDQSALALLATRHATTPSPLAAIFVAKSKGSPGSPVFAAAREQHPNALRILLHDDIELDSLVTLLDSHLITHCYCKPYDRKLIRSRVYTAGLGLQARDDEGITAASETPFPWELADQRRFALIVDDEPSATRYLKKQLERLDCRCPILCAENASEAQALLLSHGASIAVIISDHRMPGMTGSQLLNELRTTQPAVVRVLTSAWGEVDVALGALNDGRIFHYLKKPWDAAEVLKCIHSALDEHLRLTRQYAQIRATLSGQHREIIGQRKHGLLTALGERVAPLPGGLGALSDFLESLATIEVLPPSTSSVRASLETDLEQQLMRRIGAALDQKLALLRGAITPNRNVSQTLYLRHLQRYLDTNLEFEADNGQPDENLMGLLTEALETLLAASGLTPAALTLTTEPQPVLSCSSASPLRLYQHVCGPLTTVSEPLVQQQCALLMLFILAPMLGGALELSGARQSFVFSLSLGQMA